MDIFKSKIDKWLFICLALSIIACLLGASVMLQEGGTVYYSIAVVTLVAGAGFPLWIFISTQYIVKNENLKIISGPFSWVIPIESIKSVQETDSTITGPALSFDRLEITYDKDKVIIVSPIDKTQFMQRLRSEGLAGPKKKAKNQTAEKSQISSNKKKLKKQQNSV